MSHKIKKSDNDIALFILSTVFIFFSHFFQKVFHLFTFFVGHPDRPCSGARRQCSFSAGPFTAPAPLIT